MKKTIIMCVSFALILVGVVVGGTNYYNKKIEEETAKIAEEYEKNKILEDKLAELKENLDIKDGKCGELEQKIEEMTKQLEELLVEETFNVDATMIEEEIQSICELAVIEYHYTNVGAIEGNKELFGFIPVGQKSAIVTMDGILKAGIDFSKVTVKSDDDKRIITISLPHSDFLSNELDENSMCVYDEKTSLFDPITLDDSSVIRQNIKDTSVKNAEKNEVLKQSDEKAEMYIKNIVEMMPNVKDNYTIEFKYVK